MVPCAKSPTVADAKVQRRDGSTTGSTAQGTWHGLDRAVSCQVLRYFARMLLKGTTSTKPSGLPEGKHGDRIPPRDSPALPEMPEASIGRARSSSITPSSLLFVPWLPEGRRDV